MRTLICIDNKLIRHSNGTSSDARGLIEGEVYTAWDEIYIHPNNKKECYFILEFNHLKLVSRFIPISGIDETELIRSREEKTCVQ